MASRPKQIAPDVYWLALGKGLSGSNVYFVRSGSSWALIDTAWPHRGQSIKQAAESLFGTSSPPAAILLTHIHPDHVGSAVELAQAWDVPVYAHIDELPLASGGILPEYANPLDRWVIGPLLRVLPQRASGADQGEPQLADIVRALSATGGVPGLPNWEYIPTPGHTPGHVAFLRRSDGVLITGDACLTMNVNSLSDLLTGRQSVAGPPYISTWSWPTAKQSVATLASLNPRVLASGHGVPMAGSGTAFKLRAFAGQFAGSGGARTATRPSLADRIIFAFQCGLERRSTSPGVCLYRLTRGRIARTFGAKGEVLALTTRGRKSGKLRTVLVQGFRDGADLIIVASNSGQAVNPGWYYNLTTTPWAHVELMGRDYQARAEELSAEEVAAFWPRVLSIAPEYARARERTTRVIPMIRLIPAGLAAQPTASRDATRQSEKVEV